MDSVESSNRLIKTVERTESSKIHLEFGIHSENGKVAGLFATNPETIKERFDSGDLAAHVWNIDVSRRLANTDSKYICIDSIPPFIKNDEKEDLTQSEKKRVWLWMPGKPSELNSSGEVIIVGGDFSYGVLSAYANAWSKSLTDEEKNEISKLFENKTQDEKAFSTSRFSETAGEFAAGLVTALALYYVSDQVEDKGQKKLSRRNFLKLGGSIVGLGTVSYLAGRHVSDFGAAYSSDTKIANIFEQISYITRPRFTSEVWIDGRTALLISKCMEAMSQGLSSKDANASVVLGNAHVPNAKSLQSSPENRIDAISRLYKEASDFLGRVLERFPNIDQNASHHALRELFIQGSLIVVTDPENMHTTDPDSEIDKVIKRVGSFKTKEVIEAIERVESGSQVKKT